MAVKVVPVETLAWNTFDLDAIDMQAATVAGDGFTIDVSNVKDEKMVFLFQNTNGAATARTATVKKGDGVQATADLVSGDIAAGKFGAVQVETGKYKFLNDVTYKGKIRVIPSHAELKMACLVLK